MDIQKITEQVMRERLGAYNQGLQAPLGVPTLTKAGQPLGLEPAGYASGGYIDMVNEFTSRPYTPPSTGEYVPPKVSISSDISPAFGENNIQRVNVNKDQPEPLGVPVVQIDRYGRRTAAIPSSNMTDLGFSDAGIIPGIPDPTVADDVTIRAKKGEYVLPDWYVAAKGTDFIEKDVAKVAQAKGIDWTPGPKMAGEPDSMGRMDAMPMMGLADGGSPDMWEDPLTGDMVEKPNYVAQMPRSELVEPQGRPAVGLPEPGPAIATVQDTKGITAFDAKGQKTTATEMPDASAGNEYMGIYEVLNKDYGKPNYRQGLPTTTPEERKLSADLGIPEDKPHAVYVKDGQKVEKYSDKGVEWLNEPDSVQTVKKDERVFVNGKETIGLPVEEKEKWSEPYPGKVGGKTVLLRKNLSTNKVEPVVQDTSTNVHVGGGGSGDGVDKVLDKWNTHVFKERSNAYKSILANKPGALIPRPDGGYDVNFASLDPETQQKVLAINDKYTDIGARGEAEYSKNPQFLKKGFNSAYQKLTAVAPAAPAATAPRPAGFDTFDEKRGMWTNKEGTKGWKP